MSFDNDKVLKHSEFGADDNEEIKFESSSNQLRPLKKRRSVFASTCTSLKYIGSLPRKQYRQSDRFSDLLVLVCLLCALMLIILPPPLVRPPIVAVADLVFLAAIIFFIMNRIGILITLSERQAVLVWDIVVGSLLLGILLSFNAMYFIACIHR
jgi:hypothetical protein